MLEEDNKNVPEITGGGLGQRFVDIKVSSETGVALDYFVLAYSNNASRITTEVPDPTFY